MEMNFRSKSKNRNLGKGECSRGDRERKAELRQLLERASFSEWLDVRVWERGDQEYVWGLSI